MLILDSIFNQPWLIVILLVAFFGIIVFIVMTLRKHFKIFQSGDEMKSDKEIAQEEVDRVTETIEDEETLRQMEEDIRAAEKKDDKAPTAEEALQEELARTLGTVEDEETLEAMKKYAEEHPEEVEEASKEEED